MSEFRWHKLFKSEIAQDTNKKNLSKWKPNVRTKVVKNASLKEKNVFVLCDIRTSQFIHVCMYLMDGYTHNFFMKGLAAWLINLLPKFFNFDLMSILTMISCLLVIQHVTFIKNKYKLSVRFKMHCTWLRYFKMLSIKR